MSFRLSFLVFSFIALTAGPIHASNDILQSVGFDQKLDAQVPLGLEFQDSKGKTVQLARYFGDKPVILTLVYFDCPMLCTLVLNGLLKSLRAISLTAGKDFNIVTVSFNPNESPELAAKKKSGYVESYVRPITDEGWAFLTGTQANIAPLAQAVGFRYSYDAVSHQYAHASGIMVLTPSGKVSKYFYGVEYPTKDLRLGLVEASSGKIGTPVDKLLLYCFHYDPLTGKYGLSIMRTLRAGAILTLLSLGTFIAVAMRRDKSRTGMAV